MNRESYRESDSDKEGERGARIFDFEINEERRFIYFAGAKNDIMDFMSRLMACSIAKDPDRATYTRKRVQYKHEIEHHANVWLQNKENIRDSYALTFEPFRLYLLPADRAPEYLLKKFGEDARVDTWFVKMLTNSSEYTDEQKQRSWKEVRDNFERVRQEMITEYGETRDS